MKYQTIAAGGTFDHMHAGHKAFISWLLTQAENVLLGITSNEFVIQLKHAQITPYEIREKTLMNFLQNENISERITLIKIDDIYGPLLDKRIPVEAIGVTNDTYNGAVEINEKRKQLGLSVLPIEVMELIKEKDEVISSSLIREGKINTKGKYWVEEKWKSNDYILPEKFREELHKPFAQVVRNVPTSIAPDKIITVGDVTTKLFIEQGISPHLAIVDLVVERQPTYSSVSELGFDSNTKILALTNSAGHIQSDSWDIIHGALKDTKSSVIQVDGEEDLLVVPCILLAPLGYHIFYGQPRIGLVHVEVTQEMKMNAYAVMETFSSI